jgi:molybdenum cofactor synthesis domain-containing protein
VTPREGVAAVVIGNEVLSAKVVEQNGAHLVQALRARGVSLRRMTFVPDEIDAIVEAVGTARRAARWVLTSGGIGPTHDDVTVRAVALALGRRVVRLPSLEEAIRRHYGARATPEALRLAEVPEGAELLTRDGVWYPVLSCESVFMLPGVPQLFRLQLETVLQRLPSAEVSAEVLYLRLTEPELAQVLDAVALAMPDVAIGSYPQFDAALDYRVKVTVEAKDPERAKAACVRLREGWPPDAVVRAGRE